MEIEFYKCIFIGLIFFLLAVISYIYKKKIVMVLSIIMGILFLLRSGIVYMAMNFEPPEVEMEIETDPVEIELPEADLKIPGFEFYDNGKTGFGLDFLDKED